MTDVNFRPIYDVAPLLCTYHTIFSYTVKAENPIVVSHYNHEFTNDPYTTPIKDNDWCSIFISLSGNFSFILNDKIYSPSYGDAVIIREHEKYSTCFQFTSAMDYFEINLPPEFFSLAAGTDRFYQMFYKRNDGDRNMIPLDSAASSHLMETLRRIEDTPEENDILRYALVIQILDILYSTYSSTAQFTVPNKIPRTLRRAIFYIHEHFSEIVSVHEISDACSISGIYMARIFKKHLNCTPSEYLTSLRIAYAKYLLSQGESLTDACFKSGFNNYTYFTSKFKSIVGVGPAKFRKEQM